MRKNKGITLVALIITIIIMLILVSVTISIVINSGIIGKAQDAAGKTKTKYGEESYLGNILNIDGKLYASPEDYINDEVYVDPDAWTVAWTYDGTDWSDAIESHEASLEGNIIAKAYQTDETYQLVISGEGEMDELGGNDAWMEYYEDLITKVTILEGITSIGESAFDGCENLTNIKIPSSVTKIEDYAFCDCTSLNNVIIPSSVTSIGKYVFLSCYSLTNIEIPSNAACIVEAEGTFCDCENLESIIIPNSARSIGDFTFEECENLINVIIPDIVESLGEDAFTECTNLTSVTIPKSVKTIGNGAFRDCPNLTDVYYTGTSEEWSNIIIENDNTELTSATIHYLGD